MKTKINRVALVWLLSMWLAGLAVAQSIQPIYSFTNGPGYPHGGLVQGPDGNFYGTTSKGGNSDVGTVFRVTADGTLTELASFVQHYGQVPNGAYPDAGLALGPDGNFYGTTSTGGNNADGVVFKVTTNGALTTLYTFNRAFYNGSVTTNATGANPYGGLTLGPDGDFYGVTTNGGSGGYGTVFQVTTNGTLTTLFNFVNTNINGANPYAALTLGPDGNFYGTTSRGGKGYGTIFRITTNGTLTTLVLLGITNGATPEAPLTVGPDANLYGTTTGGGKGIDYLGSGTVFKLTTNGILTTLAVFYGYNIGETPYAGLTPGLDGNLYGTTYGGGTNRNGSVFKVTTNGVLTTLLTFSGMVSFTNNTGANPFAGLIVGADGNLYGTTYDGGGFGAGTVFRLTTNGTFTTLASLAYAEHGAYPQGTLTAGPDGNLYGTTFGGGAGGNGTVFKLTAAGNLTTLCSFTNADGANPTAGLTLAPDGNFYGTTVYGAGGNGIVFKITPDGTFTTLVNFGSTNGGTLMAGLTQGPDGNLYGTTYQGGGSFNGTTFMVTTDGALTTLAGFTNSYSDGQYPKAGLALGPDGNFYGTTSQGGIGGAGTVFRVTTNGTLTTLLSLGNLLQGGSGYTNTTGADLSGFTLGPDGNLYGTAEEGGRFAVGTVFELTTNGVLNTLVNFDYTNGEYPDGGLALGPDGNLYGVAEFNNSYMVFKVTTNGTLTKLANFTDTNASPWFISFTQGGHITLGPDGNFYGTKLAGGSGGAGIIYRLNLPPTILAGPTNLSAIAGGSAIFTVGLFGTAPFSYQWLFNGTPFASGTNSTLTISNIAAMNAGTYRVIVSNTWGSVTSGPAALTVLLPPAITNQPANETLPIGGTASFAVSATGTTPLAYQWYFDNAAIAGATGSQLSFGPVFTNNTGSYQIIVTNLYGSATSSVAELTVLLVPNPYGISGSAGGAVTLYLASIPGSTNRLWATTNLNLPITQWQVIATNIAADGFFQVSDTNLNAGPTKYYRLSTP